MKQAQTLSNIDSSDSSIANLPAIDCIAEIEPEAVNIIHSYWTHLHAFFLKHVVPRLKKQSLNLWDSHRSLQEPFFLLRREVTCYHSAISADRQTGLCKWNREYLLPLAQKLNLVRRVEKTVIRNAWRRGHFNRPLRGKRNKFPPVGVLLPRVRNIFVEAPFKSGTERNYLLALTDKVTGVCPTLASAEALAREWKRIDDAAAALAQGAILAFILYRELGILKHANFPGAEELLWLERFREQSSERLTVPTSIVAVMRADLLALHKVLNDKVLGKGLWDQNVLHWPQTDLLRLTYAQRFSPELRQEVASRVSAIRNYPSEVSAALFSALCGEGLTGLWNFCCKRAEISQLEDSRKRIQNVISREFGVINEDQQQQVERILILLDEAMKETGVYFSQRRMLRDAPYSIRRKRAGRGIWFSLPSIKARQQRHLKKRKDIFVGLRQILLIDPHKNETFFTPKPEDALVKVFAKKIGATEEDARAIIRDLWTHSVPGALARSDRFLSVPPIVVDFVHLHRLGHIDRSQRIGTVRELANDILADHSTATLSMTVTKNLFYGLSKPSFWNGGQGPVVRGVHQQATKVKTVRQLHNKWLLVMKQIALPILDRDGMTVHSTCYVLVVIEVATERAMSAWVSVKKPGLDELGLAIFTAIWHPWFPEWPLRGIPKMLIVPQSIGLQIPDICALRIAAKYLGFSVEDTHLQEWKGPKSKDSLDIIERLEYLGPKHVLTRCRSEKVSIEVAQEGILDFLLTDKIAFPNHTPAPLKGFGPFDGLSMPGSNSPAAGWLLPKVGQAFTEREGIFREGILYQVHGTPLPFGARVNCRAFPLPYPGRTSGFFVECLDGRLRFASPPAVL